MAMLTAVAENRRGQDGLKEGFAGGLKDLVRQAAMQIVGVLLFVSSLLLGLVLLSYDHRDPSLDVASAAIPRNIGGASGAEIADVLMQYFGLAAAALPLILFVWSLHLLLMRPLRGLILRLLTLPLILVTAAAALSVLPSPRRLGVHAGLGGAIGRLLLDPADPYGLAGRIPGFAGAAPFAAAAAAALTGLLLTLVLGVSSRDWQTVRRSARAGALRMAATSRAGTERVARRSWDLGAEGLGNGLRWGIARGRTMVGAARRDPEFDPHASAGLAPSAFAADRSAFRSPTIGPAIRARDNSSGGAPGFGPRHTLQPSVVAPKAPSPVSGRRAEALRQPSLDLKLAPAADYELPSLSLLAAPVANRLTGPSEESLQQNALMLLGVLEDFGVRGEIVKVRPGPVVTLYELEPAPGTKSSRVIGLADDIARSMSAVSVRVAVVPGRNVIGIELPNTKSEMVYLRELMGSEAYERNTTPLPLILGKDIGGAPILADLAKMPHLLIAGTTGSGKSVGINTMILSILYRLPPQRCKFIMIDPKMLELSIYDGIPHLLTPVVTNPKKAVMALKWTVREMEGRYRAMSKLGVRNIDGYNARLAEAEARGETLTRRVQTGFDPETGEPQFEEQVLASEPLPFIVVVVDEMADLMLVAGKEIEAAVQRLAQMARAAGIHIIMATQRPSVDVITGTIKANFPTRISFQVTSKIDSRTILGESGAEQLLGRGDMLYMSGGGRIMRVHGPFVSDAEVEAVVNSLKSQGAPHYIDEVTEDDETAAPAPGGEEAESGGNELYDQAVALVARERKASTSFVQRHLQIGYNRAARIMEQMEREGVVSTANHVGKREVLAPPNR